MLNKTVWWKYLIVILVLVIGTFYALPNIFGNDLGLQIRGARGSIVDTALVDRATSTLANMGIVPKGVNLDDRGVKIRFSNTENQLKAKEALESDLGRDYALSLTLISSAPRWFSDFNAFPMYLGLDLRGGVHFLLQVDMASAVNNARQRLFDNVKTTLRKNNLRNRRPRLSSTGDMVITLRKPEQREQVKRVLDGAFHELDVRFDEKDAAILLIRLKQTEIDNIKAFALEQNLTALRERIDQLGVAEPIVQQQGADRIVIQLPGVQDTARAKAILGTAATLQFHLVDEDNNASAVDSNQAPPGSKLYAFRDGQKILLKNSVVYSGENIVHAAASINTQSGGAVVNIRLDNAATDINARITGANIGRRLAVVYQEIISELKRDSDGDLLLNEAGQPIRQSTLIKEVITAPVIRSQLGRSYMIEGMNSLNEAQDLALLLRSGALAAPVEIIEERTVGPSLGQANIAQGFRSVMIGFLLVLVFMMVYYRVFGIAATIALSVNLGLIVAVLSLLQATLTLPGVAGIVLTVGMAVDANVLIFERIREEIKNGNSPQGSIHLGYNRALSTIVDANVTTLIAAVVLFYFGTGPIKGFAVTLSIGILTSMFTAILLTRVIVNGFYGGKTVKQLSI